MEPAFSKRWKLTVLAVILLLFAADALGLFNGLNNRLYDASFRLRGARPPADTIVIVGIDDKSLEALGRWPLDRSRYAELLDRLGPARVIGVDLILSEPSSTDEAMAAAVKRHGRVVLAAHFDSRLRRVLPVSALSVLPAGHVHLERDVDQISRSLFDVLSDAAGPLFSLSSIVFSIYRKGVPPVAETKPDPAGKSVPGRLVQSDFRKINYYGPPGTFSHVSMADVLNGRYPPSFFAETIVLIGVTAEGLQDRSPTPFSGDRTEMPGVEIQANALNNLLDGTVLHDAGPAWIWALNAILALVGMAAFYKAGERKAAWLLMGAFVAITAVVYFLFAAFNLWLGPGLLYATALGVFLGAYLLKLDAAARQLDLKYARVAARFKMTGPGDFGFGSGLVGLFSPGGINRKIKELLSFEDSYEKQLEEAVARRTRELDEALTVIKGMSRELILRLAKAIESRDAGTGGHVARVGLYARIIAKAMNRPEEDIETLTFASSIHDIGKIGIPDRILLKQGPLTPEETAMMQNHTRIGHAILSSSEHAAIREAALIALSHHEHWDGSGYPNGLNATAIPKAARIVAICDLYDALRSPRPYKAGLDHETAVRYITRGGPNVSPTHFDPAVLQAFKSSAPAFAEVYRLHQD